MPEKRNTENTGKKEGPIRPVKKAQTARPGLSRGSPLSSPHTDTRTTPPCGGASPPLPLSLRHHAAAIAGEVEPPPPLAPAGARLQLLRLALGRHRGGRGRREDRGVRAVRAPPRRHPQDPPRRLRLPRILVLPDPPVPSLGSPRRMASVSLTLRIYIYFFLLLGFGGGSSTDGSTPTTCWERPTRGDFFSLACSNHMFFLTNSHDCHFWLHRI